VVRHLVTPAALVALALLLGAVLVSVGVGMWIAPGAGLTVGGLALIAAGLVGVDLDKKRGRR
jgi:hypothetical protein